MSKTKIIILFVVILTIPSYLILKSKNLDFSFKNPLSIGFNQKEPNPIQDKIDLIDQSGELIITEDELESWVKPYAKSVENLEIEITTLNIHATGEATFPTRASMDLVIIPEVRDQKIIYKIEKMYLGGVTASAYISNLVTETVNKQLDSNINDILVVNSLRLEDGQMILNVEKK